MKVIDLLNKISNGEEVPQHFIVKGKRGNVEFRYRDEYQLYDNLYEEYIYINDEVEIIGEDKKIEKLEKLYKYIDKEVDEKEKYMYYDNILKVYDGSEFEIDESISFIVDKINEIIDKINKGE